MFWRLVGISGSWVGGRAWKGVCLLVCLIEKGEGEKGSGLCSGGRSVRGRGDLKSGNTGGGGLLGNRVFAKGDFVKASTRCRVVPPWLVGIPPWLAGILGVAVCTSTGALLLVVPSCFCPKSTRDIALTVVCRVVSASKLVLGVVARVVGLSTKAIGPWGELVVSSSLSKRNLG